MDDHLISQTASSAVNEQAARRTQFVHLLWLYYRQAQQAGFSSEQAFRLVLGYQHTLMINARRTATEDS